MPDGRAMCETGAGMEWNGEMESVQASVDSRQVQLVDGCSSLPGWEGGGRREAEISE